MRNQGAGPQQPEPEPPKKSHKLRWLALSLALLVAVGAGLTVGYNMIRSNYYVGVDGEKVVVLRGLPGSVLGYSIRDVDQVGCVTRAGELTLAAPGDKFAAGCVSLTREALRPSGRDSVDKGLPPGSRDDAIKQIRMLVSTELLPPCETKAQAPSNPNPSPSPAPPADPNQPGTPVTTTPAAPTAVPGGLTGGERTGENHPLEHKSEQPNPPATTAPTTTAPQTPGQNCRTAD
ncbi:hypothetical protein ACWELJ_24545 [Nocardia sp. NPDC004582]